MKKFLVLCAALTALSLAPAAHAADMPTRPLYKYQPDIAPVFNWSGFYVGGHVGYGFGDDIDGFLGGVQAGYNWQYGQFVFGGETDIQASGADDRFAGWKFSNPWFGTLRARGGFAMGNALFYGTLGLSYGALDLRNTMTGVSESHAGVGWTGGFGLEVGLMRNWSVKAEYLYVDLGSRNFVIDGASHRFDSSMLRFGVNYRF